MHTKIPVSIRYASASKSAPFGECDAADIDDVISFVERWGSACGTGGAAAQIVPNNGSVEIIVYDEDDE